ncbi:hypothetical protein DFQ28_000272 [Apophysomyces sp. BC1034]|nr:hypothetical protein DFQ30_008123 [Apophysomyces sp. BC1015]KAG0182258.1 hypothetical protein DFQ29_005141 [Apophysomyces sp. BC1021]KAG0191386.1 hypothetical protein DFQ28_000272 [Apophysomyces sp. BC1034]
MMMPTVSQPPLATPIPLPWNNHYLHAMPPVMQGHNIPTEQTQLSAAPPDQNTGESLSTTDRPVKDNNDNKGCQPLSTSDNILCNSFNATYMPIQTAASSSNVDRELSRKAKAFEQRRFIWCYRPMGSAEDHHHSPAWAAFGLSNQRRLDQYPVRDDTFTGPLTIKEAKLPGTLMVLPQKGVAYHYRSLFSARHTLLDVRCLERTSDHELVFRTDNDEGGRKASGMMGKLWNAFFR